MTAMTIRLDDDLAEALGLVAQVRATPVSDVIRKAIAAHIEAERSDPAFQTELRKRIARAEELIR